VADLADAIREIERRQAEYDADQCAQTWDYLIREEHVHAPRLIRVAKAASALFAALDYVTPGWREETCAILEDSDEVNVAWCELEAALDGERERKGADLEF
jgi:hypothetical protein